MKKRFALLTAIALMSSSMFVQAATITSGDSTVQLETPNDNWFTDDFEGAILFVTNGNDRVTVKVFEKGEEIPSPMKAEDAESYEEIYQTFYTTADCTYVITGLAQTATDMKTVRKIVQSVQLEDHMEDPSSTEATSEESTEENTVIDENDDRVDHTDYFYNEDGSRVKVYILNDGSIVDSDGNKVNPDTDGTMNLSDGSTVYEFNPTEMTLDQYLNGPNNEEYNDSGDSSEADSNNNADSNDDSDSSYDEDASEEFQDESDDSDIEEIEDNSDEADPEV